MISDRLLPLGHDRHGHTHWFLPTVGYFVESHDPRGWGYYSSLDEVIYILLFDVFSCYGNR